ncbi:MAG: RNA polymerase sigma factor [Alistipes sp.]|jgi:RNA polymerase sigma-70 factor (ECF subfamily)|nr:RNA polymerase sigma factor [Alistipes sp.]
MKKGNPNDKESVRRVLRGDLEEFSRLVGTHAPRMLRLALGIVRRRDLAEDVVQDALVKAYEKLGSWRGESSLSTWLYRIVYTTALSALRGGGRSFWEASPELPDTAGEEDDEWQVTEENIARMRRALELLSPVDRTLVTLFYLEDRSVREVAAICGESEGNVKTRLHRARGRLRVLMVNC